MGKERLKDLQQRVLNQEEKEYMQLLRSTRTPVKKIAALNQVTPQTVYNHTDNKRLPIADLQTTNDITLSLITRALIEAHEAWTNKEDLAVHREFGILLKNYTGMLRDLMEASDAVSQRAKIEALSEDIITLTEKGDTKGAEILQKIYDAKVAEL